MKKILIIPLLATIIFIIFYTNSIALTQSSSPYNTYTLGPRGRIILTQTAYEPAGFFELDDSLNNPEDMYYKDDFLYVADTGNKRIVKIDNSGNVATIVSNLNEPTGLFVDNQDNIYIADRGLKSVLKYDFEGNLLNTFEKPVEPIFGSNSPYVPTKIAVGPRGVMYVISEGSTGGVIQLNHLGEFIGFYGSNQVNLTWYQVLAKFFQVSLAKNVPTPPYNVTIDQKGSVFTVSNTVDNQLKKFNIASTNILSLTLGSRPISVVVNDFDNIYTLSQDGVIHEFDSFGNLIFMFGGTINKSNQVLGLFVTPVSMVIDKDNNILVLDKGTNQIQVLAKSEFTNLVHEGLIDFKNGIYDSEKWEEVLRMNSIFALANSALAKASYRNMDYDSALYYYKIANNKVGYSESFWQIRYQFLQNNLGIIFLGLVIIFALSFTLKTVDKRVLIFDPFRNLKLKLKGYKLVNELSLLLLMIRHPIDTFYEIKHRKKASYLSANIIFIIGLLISIVVVYQTSFIFNDVYLAYYSVIRESFITISIVLLFIFSNYLISTLSSGEGFFKDIYIGLAYALAPYILFRIPLMILSHGLTYNELFIYQSLLSIIQVWTLLLIIIMVKEIHNYKIMELIKNLLLTLFTMLMIALVIFLLYLLTNQMFDYFESLIRELIVRG